MATSKSTKEGTKPATKGQKPAEKPAGIGIKEVAAKLGRDEKSLRASIRRVRGGAQVGKGGRYEWKSFSDPDLVKLFKELKVEDKV
jgi:hypothetical protein